MSSLKMSSLPLKAIFLPPHEAKWGEIPVPGRSVDMPGLNGISPMNLFMISKTIGFALSLELLIVYNYDSLF